VGAWPQTPELFANYLKICVFISSFFHPIQISDPSDNPASNAPAHVTRKPSNQTHPPLGQTGAEPIGNLTNQQTRHV
jgi:hypothetical protein